MSKAAALTLSPRDEMYKAQVEHYLAETNKVLKRLAAEEKREARKRREWRERPNILEEVRAILQGK